MTIVAFSSLPRVLAHRALANQKTFTPEQIVMAKEHPHLFWVEAKPGKRKSISKARRIKIFERDGGRCAYCGDELAFDGFTIDHVIPVAHGGDNSLGNLRLACRACNCSKGAQIWEAVDG